jgi:hypothetical protein
MLNWLNDLLSRIRTGAFTQFSAHFSRNEKNALGWPRIQKRTVRF